MSEITVPSNYEALLQSHLGLSDSHMLYPQDRAARLPDWPI